MGRRADVIAARERKLKAGHYEVLGETLAKFEFFKHGWHPYSRFLDIEKIDLILRRRTGSNVEYREVQVKFGKLYTCTKRWELPLFSVTSWKHFKENEIASLEQRGGALYLVYVLADDEGFKGDMFIFRIADFIEIVKRGPLLGNGQHQVRISKSLADPSRWYVRQKSRFVELADDTVFEVTQHYRNFGCLEV